ncbi:uncharacterized protein LOC113273103 [Papaver somniferum]|uniref:uncharacterized protein LOC113273103 n=1 Tax=Papaver somniferum TaxID=3469 RepID=UPI000E705F88|nr:uncharacterized protein LOC113273103 [Papaver somniferum]
MEVPQVDLVLHVEESPSIDLINVSEDRYDVWKFSLIGQLDFLRLKFVAAILNLKNQWKLKGQCKMIPQGKGVIGTPVKVDEVTLNCENGLYARVLMEIDFANKIPHKLWIKTKYGGFMQSVLLTILPKFCPHCKIIGHTQPECRVMRNLAQEAEEGKKIGNKNEGSTSTPKVVNTPKSNVGGPSVKNMELFDIFETPVTQINIPEAQVQSLTVNVPINSGRFETLQNIDEGGTSMIDMLSPTKFLQLVEDNSLEKSVLKYINDKNGSVSEERVPTTSWTKVIQKPAAPALPEKKNIEPKMITVSVGDSLISGVHAHVGLIQRRILWSEMELISELKKPWLILGDFNAITYVEEKFGGRAPNRRSMLEFNKCIDVCDLIQAPKNGQQFSWSNCQYGSKRILCVLDKAMFNQLWLQDNEDWSFKVGLRIYYDHAPILGGSTNIPKPRNFPFKFQKMWISHHNFMEMVQKSWSEDIVGDPSFVFQSKLKRLKNILKVWNWEVFGDVNMQITTAEVNVQKAMEDSDKNPLDEEKLKKLVDAQNEFNTKEVHKSTLMRQKAREVEIADSLLKAIPKKVTEEDQQMLDVIPSTEEIKDIVFNIDPDSSPGPDGFFGCFYRACWQIINEDLGAKAPNHFRPIKMSNVSFKIIIKVLTVRMSNLMEKFVSPQQVA